MEIWHFLPLQNQVPTQHRADPCEAVWGQHRAPWHRGYHWPCAHHGGQGRGLVQQPGECHLVCPQLQVCRFRLLTLISGLTFNMYHDLDALIAHHVVGQRQQQLLAHQQFLVPQQLLVHQQLLINQQLLVPQLSLLLLSQLLLSDETI